MKHEFLASLSGFSDIDSVGVDASWYIDYLKKLHEEPIIRQYKEKALALLDPRPGEKILDIGCGLGLDVLAMHAHEPKVTRIFGIDNSQVMIAYAIHNAPQELIESGKIVFQKGDAHKLSFANDSFNATNSDRTLQHLADPALAFKEIVRVTKGGGRIVIADTDWETLKVHGIPEEDSDIVKRAYFEIIRNPRMGGGLEELFLQHGLKNIEVYTQETRKVGFKGIQDTLGLERSLSKAQAEGALSKGELQRLLREMQEENRDISSSLTIYIIKGIKPSIA